MRNYFLGLGRKLYKRCVIFICVHLVSKLCVDASLKIVCSMSCLTDRKFFIKCTCCLSLKCTSALSYDCIVKTSGDTLQ